MKSNTATLMLLALLAAGHLHAQSNKTAPERREKKEIVIEEKSKGKAEKMVILIDGDAITINGKPAAEYKGSKRIVIDNDISINGNTVRIPRHGRLTYGNPEGEKRAQLGVTTEKTEAGTTITDVTPGSAADKAGLKAGDVLTSVAGKPIESPTDLSTTIRGQKPSQSVAVEYQRNGKKATTNATLGETSDSMIFDWDYDFDDYDVARTLPRSLPKLPNLPPMPEWNADVFSMRSSNLRPKYGFSLQDNADGDGVKVTDVEPGSNAEKAGLKTGDVVTEVDGKAVKTLDELRSALNADKTVSTHTVKVLRNGNAELLTLRVPKAIKKADL